MPLDPTTEMPMRRTRFPARRLTKGDAITLARLRAHGLVKFEGQSGLNLSVAGFNFSMMGLLDRSVYDTKVLWRSQFYQYPTTLWSAVHESLRVLSYSYPEKALELAAVAAVI